MPIVSVIVVCGCSWQAAITGIVEHHVHRFGVALDRDGHFKSADAIRGHFHVGSDGRVEVIKPVVHVNRIGTDQRTACGRVRDRHVAVGDD